MPEPIEFHTVDTLGAGAVGDPGQRAFYIQARSESAQLTVLLEKEQVALLAAEAIAFLDRIKEQYPEDPDWHFIGSDGLANSPTQPGGYASGCALIGIDAQPWSVY